MKKILDVFFIITIWACLVGGLQCFLLLGFPILKTCLSLLVIKLSSVGVVSLFMLIIWWSIKNKQ